METAPSRPVRSWAIRPRLRLDIGWRDLASVFSPRVADRGALEARIAARAPPGTVAVVGLSVRTLFDALLAEAGAGQGRTVAASAVNVAGMEALIRAHGATLATIDIETGALAPSVDALSRAAPGAAMILLAHLYGPGPRLERRLSGAAPDCLIVEDRAQAFEGRLALSPGADVALYSFGPIKAHTALGGAVALFRDASLARAVALRLTAWPLLGDGWFLRRTLKYAALKAASWPPVFGLIHRLLAATGRDVDAMLGSAARGFSAGLPVQQAVRHRPPARLLRLLARRLERAQARDDRLNRETLVRVSALLPTPGLERETPPLWLLPVLSDRPASLIAALAREGYDATRGATSMRVIGENPAPVATALMARIVYLPRPRTSGEADRLVAALKRATSKDARASLTATGEPT